MIRPAEDLNSEYMRGYRYGNMGKFPMPAEMPDEWIEGYDDGRSDWLATINGEAYWTSQLDKSTD